MWNDVLEWIADSTMNFAKEYRAQTCVGTLEAQLAANKRATKNLLAAIEQGIITPTTKERLLELEREQAVLVSRLAEEQASLLDYSRDDIISALSLYRNGNAEDKSCRFPKTLLYCFIGPPSQTVSFVLGCGSKAAPSPFYHLTAEVNSAYDNSLLRFELPRAPARAAGAASKVANRARRGTARMKQIRPPRVSLSLKFRRNCAAGRKAVLHSQGGLVSWLRSPEVAAKRGMAPFLKRLRCATGMPASGRRENCFHSFCVCGREL